MHDSQDKNEATLLAQIEERFAAIERTQLEIFKLLSRKANDQPSLATMTLKEAARYARYSMDHFRRLVVEQGRVPYSRPSGRQRSKILFRKEDVDTFLNRDRTGGLSVQVGQGRPRKQKNNLWW